MVTKELWLSHQSLPLCVVRVAGAQLLETQWFLTSGLNILYAQKLLPALPWLLFPSRAFSLVTCLRGSNTGQRQEGDRWGVKWKPGSLPLERLKVFEQAWAWALPWVLSTAVAWSLLTVAPQRSLCTRNEPKLTFVENTRKVWTYLLLWIEF